MKIALIGNKQKDKDGAYLKKVMDIASEMGIECYVCERSIDGNGYAYTDPRSIPVSCDFVITLGGDGTILQAARDFRKYSIPIAGINLGTLGYLAETEISGVENMLMSLKNEKYILEERMMLAGFLSENGDFNHNAVSQSLNDIVIKPKDSFKTVAINLYVNDKFVTKYNADGLIISTPTGSTAYNLSAGGPIIEPTTKMIIITPICSFSLGLGSIVFGGQDKIVLEMCTGRRDDNITGEAIFDGETRAPFNSGDRILIQKSSYVTTFVKFTETSFLEILREKMQNK